MAAPSNRTPPIVTVPDATHGTLDDVAARYSLRRPEEVEDYLRRFPHLVQLALQAADLFPRYFGAEAPLALEVSSDPDGAPDDQDLFAIVQTPLATEEATDRFVRLLDEWSLAARPPGPGVLVLDIEPL